MRTRGVAAVVAMAVAGLAALVGCGDDSPQGTVIGGDETRTAEPSGTPSPTASPTAEATTPDEVVDNDGPGELDAQTEDEVKAFIQRFLDAQNKATGNGDFSEVDTLVDQCSVCDDSKRYIEGAYGSGGSVEGGLFTEPKITVSGGQGGDIFVTVVATISAYKTTDGSGKVVDQGPAAEETYQYTVAKVNGNWKLVGGQFVG